MDPTRTTPALLFFHNLHCYIVMSDPPHCLLLTSDTRIEGFRRLCLEVVLLQSMARMQTVSHHFTICFISHVIAVELVQTRTNHYRTRSTRR